MSAGASTDPADPFLLTFLADRDVPCPACGYNLRAASSARCPECGEQLELRVTPAEPKQGAVLAGLIGLVAGAGMSGLLLLYGLIRMYASGYRGFMDTFLKLTSGGFLVEGLLVFFWLSRWKKIRRCSRGTKLLLVAGCWIATLANLLIFATQVR